MMKRILINFAHPAKSRSKINNALLAVVDQLEGVTVNDLYANYPDFMIDVKREQALCESHDIIIFQHPLYWYQTPAIMKEWLEQRVKDEEDDFDDVDEILGERNTECTREDFLVIQLVLDPSH